jgi:hypothetical protein
VTAELPCCQGLPEHTYGTECLHHREESFDISTEDGRKALARKMADDWRENGGVLPPGVTYIRLEPGEHILSGEDIRRLLEGEEDQ